MKHEADDNINSNCCAWNNPKSLCRRFRSQRKRGDHLNYSIVKISQNTVKGPGDLRRLAVT